MLKWLFLQWIYGFLISQLTIARSIKKARLNKEKAEFIAKKMSAVISELSTFVKQKGAILQPFGSIANGKWRLGSDIDLLVYSNRKLSRKDRKDIYEAFWRLLASTA